MKLTPEFIQLIQDAFQKMQSKSDFLALLNLAKEQIYGEKTIPFSEKQLNYFITKDSRFLKSKVDFQLDLSGDELVIKENVIVEKETPKRNRSTAKRNRSP